MGPRPETGGFSGEDSKETADSLRAPKSTDSAHEKSSEDDITARLDELKQQIEDLSEEERKEFEGAIEKIGRILKKAINGSLSVDHLLTSPERELLGRYAQDYRETRASDSTAKVSLRFDQPTDEAVYTAMVYRLAFSLMAARSAPDTHKRRPVVYQPQPLVQDRPAETAAAYSQQDRERLARSLAVFLQDKSRLSEVPDNLRPEITRLIEEYIACGKEHRRFQIHIGGLSSDLLAFLDRESRSAAAKPETQASVDQEAGEKPAYSEQDQKRIMQKLRAYLDGLYILGTLPQELKYELSNLKERIRDHLLEAGTISLEDLSGDLIASLERLSRPAAAEQAPVEQKPATDIENETEEELIFDAHTKAERQKHVQSLLILFLQDQHNFEQIPDNVAAELEGLKKDFKRCKKENAEFTVIIQNLSKDLMEFLEAESLKIPVNQLETRTVRKVEWRNVKRHTNVVAVGDLFGSEEALHGNLESLEVARVNQDGEFVWAGSDSQAVFLGDIAGDRQTHGLDCLLKISKLREQAKAAGGEITTIVGNHDDFLVSFLMGIRAGGGADPWVNCIMGRYNGLTELHRFGSEKLKVIDFATLGGGGRSNAWLLLQQEQPEIVKNMRASAEGREVLESLCSMKIVEIIDDTLFLHTDPTMGIISTLLKNGPENVRHNIDVINNIYQKSLKESLLRGEVISEQELFIEIKNVFLNTENRYSYDADLPEDKKADITNQLRLAGINMIVHGHSQYDSYSKFDVGDLIITSVDMGAFKSKPDDTDRSILRIERDGVVTKGREAKKIRE